ncbi:hypothetical protein ACE7GA_22315 [Roseomonas sp. CCTCC AB2023176]|uniref:hypothetical protein n=1 Tax=Roseomonas sp. CCTCC AB2023176 TaxID=3342640 RepID=UPI0035DE4449
MSSTIAAVPGGLNPAELKALTDGDGNFSITTVQWQDAAKTAAESTVAKPSAKEADAPGAGSENTKLAKDLLREARETKDPELKAELIKSALDLLQNGDAAGKDGAAGAAGASGKDGASATSADDAKPQKFEGDALKPYLTAEGGNVEQGKDGGWAVGDAPGNGQKIEGEINRGQSLTFTAPVENKDNAGGTVELGKLYKNGPDGDHVEKARVTFYDENGKVVDEKIVEGTKDGNASVSTDKKFARVEVSPEDNGAKGSSDNSDFALKSVSLNAAGETTAAAAKNETGEKINKILDVLGMVAGLIPGIGPMAGPALDKVGDLVEMFANRKSEA